MIKLNPPTTIERYFTLHYGLSLASRAKPALEKAKLKAKPPAPRLGEDTCIARHHNGICVVCISPRHPIITQNKKLATIDYRVPLREVKGKRKKGGILVEPVTRLCSLKCESGEEYTVKCAVKGTLIEYNDAFKSDPALAASKPLTDGYLAIVLPSAFHIKTSVDLLTSAEDYEQLWDREAASAAVSDTVASGDESASKPERAS